MKKAWVLNYPVSAQRRLIRLGRCPGWYAQADLSLRWAHSHIVGFVMSRLMWLILFQPSSSSERLHETQVCLGCQQAGHWGQTGWVQASRMVCWFLSYTIFINKTLESLVHVRRAQKGEHLAKLLKTENPPAPTMHSALFNITNTEIYRKFDASVKQLNSMPNF